MAWLWIILALVYILSPYDLLPDIFPIGGWLDDGVILFFVVQYLIKFFRRRSVDGQEQPRQRPDDQTWHKDYADQKRHDESPQSDPYTTLGVSPNATQAEIREAYRKLANQYHPDKVAHLGKEFQQLAEKRFKEIQNAYDQLK